MVIIVFHELMDVYQCLSPLKHLSISKDLMNTILELDRQCLKQFYTQVQVDYSH